MTPDRMVQVVEKYREYLSGYHIEPKRIDIRKTFGMCTRNELLAHARYLAENFRNIDLDKQYGKANRHLAALQMCLSFANEYTLEELMNHNRPG